MVAHDAVRECILYNGIEGKVLESSILRTMSRIPLYELQCAGAWRADGGGSVVQRAMERIGQHSDEAAATKDDYGERCWIEVDNR
jgi:hypothetical protein